MSTDPTWLGVISCYAKTTDMFSEYHCSCLSCTSVKPTDLFASTFCMRSERLHCRSEETFEKLTCQCCDLNQSSGVKPKLMDLVSEKPHCHCREDMRKRLRLLSKELKTSQSQGHRSLKLESSEFPLTVLFLHFMLTFLAGIIPSYLCVHAQAKLPTNK